MVINHLLANYPEHSITTDHYQAAVQLFEQIIAQGHQQIAFITGLADSNTGKQRLAAYQDTLAKHQLTLDQALSAKEDWTPESGYLAAQQLLNRSLPISAIVAGNDDMAIGASKALLEAGKRIPQDISSSGFDNSKIAQFVTLSLTTVGVPIAQMLQKAILHLLGQTEQAQHINLQGQVIWRDSVVDIK